jgi:predicted transcriptional regulator
MNRLSDQLNAIASEQRMRILASLADGAVHVSELARMLGMSRPLLYMHLGKLEEAGFISGKLELSADGKAFKYFEIKPFSITVDINAIRFALASESNLEK